MTIKQREIYNLPRRGSSAMADVLYEDGTYIIVLYDGIEYVCEPAMGTMRALSTMDIIMRLKESDNLDRAYEAGKAFLTRVRDYGGA